MTKVVLTTISIASILLACTPRHTHFATNTGYEAEALRKARALETRVLNADYLVSCAVVLDGFADCAVLMTPDLSTFRVFCHIQNGCFAQRIHTYAAQKGGKDE